ncbi:MAG: aminotransferase class I/II-fold pyridoxal phosphate-dependent enzyme [Gammaproteobacteria bacterium]|nr:aminotransferase class I/II-fold pyridoxal phosphate-dependent enzyme [Gammaproteobacteria bacterium]
MSNEAFRQLGYRIVDMVVDRHREKDREPAIAEQSPEWFAAQLSQVLPVAGQPIEPLLSQLADSVLAYQQHGDHPRYFARVPSPASYAAILGEWLATGFNTISTSWGGGAGPAAVEKLVMTWLAELLDLPQNSEGVLLSGGSMANFTAFAVAKHERGLGTVYLHEQTHSSLKRNLQNLGFADTQIRVLPCNWQFAFDLEVLRSAIEHDLQAGNQPMMVVASAGTTNTGTVDDLQAISALCQQHALWLHVDGAYGAPAYLTERGKVVMQGLSLADSVVLDPHKWFFQPYDVGACLIRHPGALERCFGMYPEYLKDSQGEHALNFGNRSLELTRRSRAVKLWLSMQTYGTDAMAAGIDVGIDLALYAQSIIEASERWELVTPAQLGVVCLALKGARDGQHAIMAHRLAESGYACVSSTTLAGRSVLRLCTINPLTTTEDIDQTLSRLLEFAG